jgi:GT2 family glycosyltransferase
MPDLALTDAEAGRTTRLKPHAQPPPDAGIDASVARAKELEAELVARNTHLNQLQRAISDSQTALLRARDDITAIERRAATLGARLDKMQRQYEERRRDRPRSDAQAAALQAVLDERARVIERLERAAAVHEEMMSQLQRELADRAAWAFRTVETLISAQLPTSSSGQAPATVHVANQLFTLPSTVTREGSEETSPQPLEHPQSDEHISTGERDHLPARESGETLMPPCEGGTSDLDLLRRALELEQRERHRLEGVVQAEYVHLKRRVIEAVERLVPRRATVVIASKGDDDLLKVDRRRAWHFPQTEDAVYAGHYPADSAAAITHLERLRSKGAQFLVFPATSCWWLDHYAAFATHLQRYRRVLERPDVGVVFDLRRPRALRPDWKTDLTNILEEFQTHFHRNPAILDCGTDLGIAESFPQQTVFSPPAGPDLPYLGSSIDVVVCNATSPRFQDARRVARVVLLTVITGSRRSRGAVGNTRMQAKWLEPTQERKAPEVSIVIPCHNSVQLTRACLEALDTTLPSSFAGEVIVIDDASTDGTQAMLARWTKRYARGRVLRNPKNSGFIASCNRAARAARGDVLVFLNNDTQPLPGWLTALLRTFDDQPDAGVVGGKLTFPDGRLQEAGSLVFRDGSAAHFGRGDRNPDHPLFNYVRQVDYCSGALLATPRRLFLELGGFDSHYLPAYYEDVDYCFRVRATGRRVYYQPAAKVTHHEGASCGTDLGRGVKRHQTLNRAKFRERWRVVLDRYPERPLREDLETWQRLAVRRADGATKP